MAQARSDHDPYEQARQDPGFLRAVEAAHRGRWAALDALWWSAHPDETSPGGTASPTVRLRALQRRVFAQDGDAAGDLAAARAVRELELEISAEQAAIAAAVLAATAGTTAAPGAETQPSPEQETLPHDGAASLDNPGDVPLGTGARLLGTVRGRWVLVAALAAALALGAVLGSQLSATTRSGATAPTPTATATADPHPRAAEVFTRPQEPQDIPLVPVPESYDPADFRYLGSAGFSDDNGDGMVDSPFYAARGDAGLFCLVVVPDTSGYLSTCTHEAEFPPSGLRLSWESTDIFSTQADGVRFGVVDLTAVWYPDGSADLRGAERSTFGR